MQLCKHRECGKDESTRATPHLPRPFLLAERTDLRGRGDGDVDHVPLGGNLRQDPALAKLVHRVEDRFQQDLPAGVQRRYFAAVAGPGHLEGGIHEAQGPACVPGVKERMDWNMK